MTETFYVTFTATGTFHGHANTISDFYVATPWHPFLRGEWECALTEITLECPQGTRDRVYLCSDALRENYVNANRVQLLRNVELDAQGTAKRTFLDPRYIAVIPGSREYLHFFLLNDNLTPVTGNGSLFCVLHFRNRETISG